MIARNVSLKSTNVLLPLVFFVSAALIAPAQAAGDSAEPVTELVRQFTDAQRNRDVAALSALTSANYVEISPVGELDSREKMLTFYVKDRKAVAPSVRIEDTVTHMLPGAAIVIAKITYSMTVDGQSRSSSLRSSFVAQKFNDGWKLVSAHYTAIRPSKNPG
jgi:ketosteroid isomerase-like protein